MAHEALYFGVEVLDFAPIPGLATAAKTLLNIWDAFETVDVGTVFEYGRISIDVDPR